MNNYHDNLPITYQQLLCHKQCEHVLYVGWNNLLCNYYYKHGIDGSIMLLILWYWNFLFDIHYHDISINILLNSIMWLKGYMRWLNILMVTWDD